MGEDVGDTCTAVESVEGAAVGDALEVLLSSTDPATVHNTARHTTATGHAWTLCIGGNGGVVGGGTLY